MMRWAVPLLALVSLLATSGCDVIERIKARRHHKAQATTSAPAPSIPDPADCAGGWTVTLDEDSFKPANLNSGRLDEFALTAAQSAARAADAACLDGVLNGDKARAVHSLVIATTTEKGAPLFRFEGDSVRVEWNFVGNDLAIPSEMEWRAGLTCAIDRDSKECGHEGVAE